MRMIGITGGIGAGKSELLKYIGQHYRCEIYRADQVAHEIEKPGQECYELLVGLMGRDILSFDGTIDKEAMSAKIFADRELLQKVNQIVHPAVREYLLDRAGKAGNNPKVPFFFIEAALLIEAGYGDIVDEMWYVYAADEVRKKRLIQSRGYSERKIRDIMKEQLKDDVFRKKSDFVIDNSGELKEAYRQIDERLARYGACG